MQVFKVTPLSILKVTILQVPTYNSCSVHSKGSEKYVPPCIHFKHNMLTLQ